MCCITCASVHLAGSSAATFTPIMHVPLQCTSREIEVTDPSIRAAVGGVRFFSETIRAIKVPGLEDSSENYGETVVYNGRYA